MFEIKDKVVIVTGSEGLIGSAFAKALKEAGADIISADIKNGCDITKEEDIGKLIESTLGKFGKIDALVNNAYPRNKNFGRKFEDVTFEDFCENVNMHLGGYFLMTQRVVEVMKKQGHGNIINMASIYGFSAPKFEIYKGTNMTASPEYAAIKGGIINLTKYLASYLGKCNIRVNAISPGGVLDNQPKEFLERYCQKVVLGNRMANTDDLTGVMVFLLSDASKYITGQNIVVDGGFTL